MNLPPLAYRLRLGLWVLVLFLVLPLCAHANKAPLIAAASNLQFALPKIADAFKQESGYDVRLVFGSSGNFSRQIQQGAPFELFLAANEDYALDLAKRGMTDDIGELYAKGRLALLVPAEATLPTNPSAEDLSGFIASEQIRKFAIANPDHAPYGETAKQTLQQLKVWGNIQEKLVIGENVSQATQFVLSGNAQSGIVAFALVKSLMQENNLRIHLIDEAFHAPLLQRMVLTQTAGPVAQQFYKFMQSESALNILQNFGFYGSSQSD